MIYLTATISVSFLIATWVWSLRRAVQGPGRVRIVHAMIALLMLAGGWAVWQNQPGLGMPAGLVLSVLSLGVLFFDTSPARWLAFVQLFGGMLLAAGLPFVTA